MSGFQIRAFTPDDIPQVMALQQEYQRCYPHASVIPGEVYLSPGFESGVNIFCAMDQQGCLQGYAPVLPSLTMEPDLPNIVWAEVKAKPLDPIARETKDLLFDAVLDRVRESKKRSPDKPVQLTFQYHPSESDAVECVISKGCAHTAPVFRMMRDLSMELPATSNRGGIEVRFWRMESEAEQQAYMNARKEAFPESPVSLADWQAFMRSAFWQSGCAVTALDGDEIVGCVAAYCDDDLSRYTGNKAGITEYIFVRSRWRGRGIAAYLVSQALHFLRERGRDAAYLEVNASNENALGLYRRLGYEVVSATWLYALEL